MIHYAEFYILSDNRPYWFDMPEVIQDIWKEVNKTTAALADTASSLTVTHEDNMKARKYTGVRLVNKKTKHHPSVQLAFHIFSLLMGDNNG